MEPIARRSELPESITAAWDSYDKTVLLAAFVQRLSEG